MKIELAEGWQVTVEMHGRAWLIQQLEGERWFTRAIATERNTLLTKIMQLCKDVTSEAMGLLKSLPEHPQEAEAE
jgi:hypothetical protein